MTQKKDLNVHWYNTKRATYLHWHLIVEFSYGGFPRCCTPRRRFWTRRIWRAVGHALYLRAVTVLDWILLGADCEIMAQPWAAEPGPHISRRVCLRMCARTRASPLLLADSEGQCKEHKACCCLPRLAPSTSERQQTYSLACYEVTVFFFLAS